MFNHNRIPNRTDDSEDRYGWMALVYLLTFGKHVSVNMCVDAQCS